MNVGEDPIQPVASRFSHLFSKFLLCCQKDASAECCLHGLNILSAFSVQLDRLCAGKNTFLFLSKITLQLCHFYTNRQSRSVAALGAGAGRSPGSRCRPLVVTFPSCSFPTLHLCTPLLLTCLCSPHRSELQGSHVSLHPRRTLH